MVPPQEVEQNSEGRGKMNEAISIHPRQEDCLEEEVGRVELFSLQNYLADSIAI